MPPALETWSPNHWTSREVLHLSYQYGHVDSCCFLFFHLFVFPIAHAHAQSLTHVWLFLTPWTVACQTSLSLEFPRQEYCSVLPFPSFKDPPDSGIKSASPASPVLQEDSLPLSHLIRHPTCLLLSKTNICIYSKAEDFKTSASTSCPITAKFRGFNIPCLNLRHCLPFCLTSMSWDPQHYIPPKLHTLKNCKSIIYMPNKQISKCHQFIKENGPELLLLITKFCITWSLSSLLLCYHTVKTLSLDMPLPGMGLQAWNLIHSNGIN